MDRHPQQIKRERQDKKRNAINSAKLSDMRTAIKRVLQSEDPSKAEAPYKKAVSVIDKMVSKGHLKKIQQQEENLKSRDILIHSQNRSFSI